MRLVAKVRDERGEAGTVKARCSIRSIIRSDGLDRCLLETSAFLLLRLTLRRQTFFYAGLSSGEPTY